MANNLIQIKRTSVAGRAANTTTLPNPGELALNMTDGILYSGNGSVVFEIGANNTNVNVSGNLTVNGIIANGAIGGLGTVLTSNGSSVYWGPGAAGYTGSKGDTGFTGSQGIQGLTGYDGSQGLTGFTGSAGYTGSFGDTGYTGSTGFTGSQGLTGYDGSQGLTGYTGSIGYTGSQGDVGYVGSQGIQGTTGFVGSQGGTGYTGSQGEVGFTGSFGLTGYTGSKGDTGNTGYDGSRGDTGFTGSQGPTGTFGGAAFEYVYSSNTTHNTTANGYFNFDNIAFNSVTTLYVDYIDSFGANSYTFLQTIDDSTSSIKGHFSIRDSANALNYAMFAITGSHTEDVDHFDIPVSYLSGVTSFTNNTNTIITFARTGDIGDTGYTGSTGFVGSQGLVGYTGSLGYSGSQGTTGYTGSQGDQGTTGFVGSQGGTGYTGSQGDVGYTGSKGDQGIQGVTGYTGSLGFTGSKGDTGFTGSQGLTGYDGSQGNTGFTGSLGYTGSAGANGYTGSKGDLGYTGSAGTSGYDGSVGYTGSKGDIGFTGSQGPVAGSNTQVIFNDNNAANGNPGFTFNKTTQSLSVNGSILVSNSVNIANDIKIGTSSIVNTEITSYSLSSGVGAFDHGTFTTDQYLTSYGNSFSTYTTTLDISTPKIVTFPTVALVTSSGFCVEFFIKFNTLSTTSTLTLFNDPNASNKLQLEANTSYIQIANAGYEVRGSANFTLTTGVWYHFAYMGSGSETYIAINGVVKALGSLGGGSTYTEDGTWSQGWPNISGPATYSNFRVITGRVPYPLTSFVPPNYDLPNTEDTQILTLQDSTFTDVSKNAGTITTSGTPTLVKSNVDGMSHARFFTRLGKISGATVYLGNTTVNTYITSSYIKTPNLNTVSIYANSSYGTAGQVLTSNGTGIYWSTAVGYTGSAGPTGFTGSIGSIGFTGSVGFTGSQGSTGYDGSRGDTGFTGSQGPSGTFGGAAFDYTFNANTDNSNPGNGQLKLSNSNLSFANTLYINENDDTFTSVYNFLQTIDDSTSAIKGHFSIAEKGNTAQYSMFSITGNHTHNTNYFAVPVSYLSGSNSFTNAADIIITFARTGDIGDTGYTGSTGFVGSQGLLGYTGSVGIGYDGSKGDTGFTGSIGSTGFTGSAGVDGYTGSKGDIGYTGSTGASGTNGYDGSVGFTGSAGYNGSVGFTGSIGIGYTGSAGTGGGASVSIGTTPPGSPSDGDLWWNSEEGVMYVYYNDGNTSQWVEASPTIPAGGGTSGISTGKSIAMALVFGG